MSIAPSVRKATREMPAGNSGLRRSRARRYREVRIRDASPLLQRLREKASEAERQAAAKAIDITVEAQKAAMARVLTAAYEYDLQATVEYTFEIAAPAAGRSRRSSRLAGTRRRCTTRPATIRSIGGACCSRIAARRSRTTRRRRAREPGRRAILAGAAGDLRRRP